MAVVCGGVDGGSGVWWCKQWCVMVVSAVLCGGGDGLVVVIAAAVIVDGCNSVVLIGSGVGGFFVLTYFCFLLLWLLF